MQLLVGVYLTLRFLQGSVSSCQKRVAFHGVRIVEKKRPHHLAENAAWTFVQHASGIARCGGAGNPSVAGIVGL